MPSQTKRIKDEEGKAGRRERHQERKDVEIEPERARHEEEEETRKKRRIVGRRE